tara:strand:- start:3502 stop:3885 length:384 start_codon:yes stop_codon:yes gene_type:complete
VIIGDAGGDPVKIASGETNGSIVLSPKGFKKKKIKSFAEFTEENIVERWNPFSDLDNHKIQNFFMGSGKIKDAIILFNKMLQRVDAGKWNYSKRPLDILADLTNLKSKLLAFELRKAGFSEEQIFIK